MRDDKLTATLGRCWSFPPHFSPDTGVRMTEGIDAVLQSLRVLFMTEPGERIMREAWGGGMYDFVFENISDELVANIQNRIEESILRSEPRATLKDVTVQPARSEAGRLRVHISVYLSGSDISETLEGMLNINEGQTLRLL